MGLNYFEFYGIPSSFNPNELLVKRKFYELSKLYHPDFYISEPEEKQQEILELSTLNNKAYQVLSDPGKRLAYMLELNGMMEDRDKHPLPADFLMEMMEINEVLMELEFDPDASKLADIRQQTEEISQELSNTISSLGADYDLEGSDKAKILSSLKDLYFRQKYLLRIRESLSKFAQ